MRVWAYSRDEGNIKHGDYIGVTFPSPLQTPVSKGEGTGGATSIAPSLLMGGLQSLARRAEFCGFKCEGLERRLLANLSRFCFVMLACFYFVSSVQLLNSCDTCAPIPAPGMSHLPLCQGLISSSRSVL